jgi:hypothetical protein
MWEEGLFTVDVDLADVRRERIALPLLRDERPELVVREWQRLVAERAGLAGDSTAEAGSAPGHDVAPENGVVRGRDAGVLAAKRAKGATAAKGARVGKGARAARAPR